MSLDPRFNPLEITQANDLLIGDNQSLRSRRFTDFYFQPNLGKEESTHVFIQGNQLVERWKNHALNPSSHNASFVIAETGFGTGLNFLTAMHYWQQIYQPLYKPLQEQKPSHYLDYIAVEKYPLSHQALQKAIKHYNPLPELADKLLALYPDPISGNYFLDFSKFNINVRLRLIFADALEGLNQLEQDHFLSHTAHHANNNAEKQRASTKNKTVDAWFLDGFAPRENQSMWQEKLFHSIATLSKKESKR